MDKPSLPYWRLSSFYLVYFALLGALLPFWGLYLEFLGMTVGDIGILMAILMITRVGAPNLWGWIADYTQQRIWVIRFGSLLALIVFSTAFWADTFWQLACLIFAFSFFWNAVLPQFEVVTLEALGDNRSRYSQIRLWGSIGFIVAVVGLGMLFDYVSIKWLVPILWVMILLIWISTMLVSAPRVVVPPRQKGAFWSVLQRREVFAFLLVSFLVQLSHGPYYTFYSIYITEVGYSKTEIGLLWALGVIAEVFLFIYMHKLLDRFGAKTITIIAAVGCLLRWILIGTFPDELAVLLFAQLLHAITFGCSHAAAIALVHEFFPKNVHGQGQAIYSSCGFGLGGAVGAYLSGVSWTLFGSNNTFLIAAVVAISAIVVAVWGFRGQHEPKLEAAKRS